MPLHEIQTFFFSSTEPIFSNKILFSDHFHWHHYATWPDIKWCVTADQIIIKIHFLQMKEKLNDEKTNYHTVFELKWG